MKKARKKAPPGAINMRGSRGPPKGDASFPAPPSHSGLPDNYTTVLSEIKQRI